jgi:hypothetical protein
MNGLQEIQDNYNTLGEQNPKNWSDIRFRVTLSDGTVLPASYLRLNDQPIGEWDLTSATADDSAAMRDLLELSAKMRLILDLPAPLFHPTLDLPAYVFKNGDVKVESFIQK